MNKKKAIFKTQLKKIIHQGHSEMKTSQCIVLQVHQLTVVLSCHCWYSEVHFRSKSVRLSSVTPEDVGIDDFFSLS